MAFITASKCLPLQQVCIPARFERFQSPASWKIRVISHRPREKRIFAEVLAYNTFPSDFTFFQLSENPALHELEKIDFRSIDTNGLLGTIRGSKGGRVFTPSTESIPTRTDHRHNTTKVQEHVPQSLVIKESFQIPIQEVHFKSGRALFTQRIEQLGRNLEFEVVNENIKEEFDAIKNYFGNALRVKKIHLIVEIVVNAGQITKTSATSPDILRIDLKIIEGVKFELVKGIIRNDSAPEMDQSLFTLEELFHNLPNVRVQSTLFYNNDDQFFTDLLNITNTKHYKHLRYLSEFHAHSVLKLRFITKPFSFLFLIASSTKYFLLWETLDTKEATYVWEIDKDLNLLKQTLPRIDEVLNFIKLHGRNQYLQRSEVGFKRIFHDYSDEVIGFEKWKEDLHAEIK